MRLTAASAASLATVRRLWPRWPPATAHRTHIIWAQSAQKNSIWSDAPVSPATPANTAADAAVVVVDGCTDGDPTWVDANSDVNDSAGDASM